MTLDVYAQLEQRVKREHGASFDRLMRQARELRGEDSTTREAAQLVLNRYRPQNRSVFGPRRIRPSSPKNRPQQGKRRVARPGIEPGTPRFSESRENPWLSPHLQDFFW
jgi:hypothetical protein